MLDEYDEPVEFKFDPHATNGNSSNRSNNNNNNDDDDIHMANNCGASNGSNMIGGGTNGSNININNISNSINSINSSSNIHNTSLSIDVCSNAAMDKHQQQAARQQALLLAAQSKHHQQQLVEAAAVAAVARNAKMSAIVAASALPNSVTLLNSMVALPKLEPIVKSAKPRVNKRSKVKQNGIKAEISNTSSVSSSC